MKVFDDPVQIRKKEDGSYTISVALSDSMVVVKVLSRNELEKLGIDIEKILRDS